jgi:hypothetical protein
VTYPYSAFVLDGAVSKSKEVGLTLLLVLHQDWNIKTHSKNIQVKLKSGVNKFKFMVLISNILNRRPITSFKYFAHEVAGKNSL